MAWPQNLWILIELEAGRGWPSVPFVPAAGDLGTKPDSTEGGVVDYEDMRPWEATAEWPMARHVCCSDSRC